MPRALEMTGLDALAGAEAQVRAGLFSSFEDLLRHAEGLVQQFAPRDTDTFADSITHEITGSYPVLEGDVFSTIPNDALVNTIEDGRGPGKTPPPTKGEAGDQLEAWADRHGFEDPHRARFALAKSIAARGTPSFAPFQKAHDAIESELPSMIEFITVRIVGGMA